MKHLVIPVMAVLLSAAGTGLASAAVALTAHHSIAAGHTMPARPTAPVTVANNSVPTSDYQASTAATVEQAMHAVLPNAVVGFEVYDRQTNAVLTGQNADQQFASMSVVKLLIALDILAATNWATPDSVSQEIHQMLADSDDDVANRLWSAGGGSAIVTRMVSLLRLTGTRPPDDPGQWGDTLITPKDMVTVYLYITDQLPKGDRDLVLGALADAPQTAADGFNQYFGIPDGMVNIPWAIKQGWGTSGSQAVMNSTGLVGTDLRYVVVMMAAASANSYFTVPTVVTAGAGAIAGLVGLAAP